MRSHPKDPKRFGQRKPWSVPLRGRLGAMPVVSTSCSVALYAPSSLFKLPPPALGADGCCGADRRVHRSPTGGAKALQASSPRPPPLASLSSCPRGRLSSVHGVLGQSLIRRGPGNCSGSLLVVSGRARRPSDFFAVFLMDQGRGRSVAPTRPILRPQTRYKGRGYSMPQLL